MYLPLSAPSGATMPTICTPRGTQGRPLRSSWLWLTLMTDVAAPARATGTARAATASPAMIRIRERPTTAQHPYRDASCAPPGPLGRLHRLGQRLDEILELIGAPALERGAVLGVGGDHRVAVVPVELGLGVQPERAPRLGGDRREHVVARRPAVGAGVAEDDHGGAR